jgi:uncharacterized surface protein with fasciclin (FAS1) repeats
MHNFKKIFLTGIALVCFNTSFSQSSSSLENAGMSASKNILENLTLSAVHATFLNAINLSGMSGLLAEQGPYTLFAPVNDAFGNLQTDVREKLLNADNTPRLKDVLQYHVIQGSINSKELTRLIKLGNGFASLKTINGKSITVSMKGSKIVLKDENGGSAIVTSRDMTQQNGMIHFIDNVLQPK